MSRPEPLPYFLECPSCCGEECFRRAENAFGDGERERCPECGTMLCVRVEEYYGDDGEARMGAVVEEEEEDA